MADNEAEGEEPADGTAGAPEADEEVNETREDVQAHAQPMAAAADDDEPAAATQEVAAPEG